MGNYTPFKKGKIKGWCGQMLSSGPVHDYRQQLDLPSLSCMLTCVSPMKFPPEPVTVKNSTGSTMLSLEMLKLVHSTVPISEDAWNVRDIVMSPKSSSVA